MFDIIALTTNIGVIGYLIFTLIVTKDIPALSSNYIFLIYLVFTVLTLPMLISKILLRQKGIGLKTALGYLIFLIEYIAGWGISKLFNLELSGILLITGYLNILIWNTLFVTFLFSEKNGNDLSQDIIKDIILGFIPASIYLIILLYIRSKDSLVALDYLQHLTVPNRIASEGILCILPGQCSNLFLQHGYTTIYHSILGFLTTFVKTDPLKIFYIIDLVFPFVASIPLYSFFKKSIGNRCWASVAVLTTLLTFIMGAYDFVFFIPQTLALLFFLMIYQDQKLTVLKMIIGTILLILSHFIIGTYLSVVLWTAFITLKNFTSNKDRNLITLLLLLTTLFFISINIAGFSLEKLIQTSAINVIGGLTNPYFPNNLTSYFSVLGPVLILTLISIVAFLFSKKKDNTLYLSIQYILITTTVYFLAPTYANKFLIGIGIFSSVLIYRTICILNWKPLWKGLATLATISSFALIFYTNYKTYLRFYTQNNGEVSALVNEDQEIIKYLNEKPSYNKMIISDPYTQLTIASLANKTTANAQYMKLKSRISLHNFLAEPNEETWERLIIIEELKNTQSFSILYTSRLDESINEGKTAWLYNIYSLIIDNNYDIKEQPSFVKYLIDNKSAKIKFENNNFILIDIPQTILL